MKLIHFLKIGLIALFIFPTISFAQDLNIHNLTKQDIRLQIEHHLPEFGTVQSLQSKLINENDLKNLCYKHFKRCSIRLVTSQGFHSLAHFYFNTETGDIQFLHGKRGYTYTGAAYYFAIAEPI